MIRQPDEIGSAETQSAYLIVTDADSIHARAKAAGAHMAVIALPCMLSTPVGDRLESGLAGRGLTLFSKETSMATQIFVNLPVSDLTASIAFFTRLGFTFDSKFTDDTATCMIVGDQIFVMLLTHDKFKTFTPKPVCDATQSTEVLVCLSRESREAVDTMVREAVAAGGSTYN